MFIIIIIIICGLYIHKNFQGRVGDWEVRGGPVVQYA